MEETNRLYTIFLSRHSIKLHIFGFRPRMLGISSRGIFFRSFCSHVYIIGNIIGGERPMNGKADRLSTITTEEGAVP